MDALHEDIDILNFVSNLISSRKSFQQSSLKTSLDMGCLSLTLLYKSKFNSKHLNLSTFEAFKIHSHSEVSCTTVSLPSLLDLPHVISIKLCFHGSLLSPTVTWHMQKENYSTNARLRYARNEDQHSNYIKNKRLTKQFRKTSTEGSKAYMLYWFCFTETLG